MLVLDQSQKREALKYSPKSSKLSCRNISRTIRGNGLGLIFIIKAVNSYVNLISWFFVFNKFVKIPKNLFPHCHNGVFLYKIWRKGIHLMQFGIWLYHNKLWMKWSTVNIFQRDIVIKWEESFSTVIYQWYCYILLASWLSGHVSILNYIDVRTMSCFLALRLKVFLL